MEWFLRVVKEHYADFNGRARRQEYWMFVLFNLIFAIAAMILDRLFGIAIDGIGYGPLYGLYILATLVPSLAVAVRRLHDTGKSGFMLFVSLIPIAGAIWLIVLLVQEGTTGPNQYGPDPKGVAATI